MTTEEKWEALRAFLRLETEITEIYCNEIKEMGNFTANRNLSAFGGLAKCKIIAAEMDRLDEEQKK